MGKEVLYVGLDDSNHGEQQKRLGEIIVLTYSYNCRHCWDSRKMVNRRAYLEVEDRLKEGIFNYIFTIIPHQIAKNRYSNLPLALPFLLDQISLKEGVFNLKAGLDGRLSNHDRNSLRKILEKKTTFQDISIKNFIKKNGVHKGPPLIYFADVIANNIFNSTLKQISEDEKFFPISKSQLNFYLEKFSY